MERWVVLLNKVYHKKKSVVYEKMLLCIGKKEEIRCWEKPKL